MNAKQLVLGNIAREARSINPAILERIAHPGILDLVRRGRISPSAGLRHGTEEAIQTNLAKFRELAAQVAANQTKMGFVKSPALLDLLKAKKFSDHRDFAAKNSILAALIRQQPTKFYVDSELNPRYVGLTHKPTGFKIHAPRKIIPEGIEYRLPKDETKDN